MSVNNTRVADFFYELGLLNRFKRSGFDFLGENISQNIASHSFRVAMIGYTLASMVGGANKANVALMCLFHDVPEARTGDINKFQEKYTAKDETNAIADVAKGLPFEQDFINYLNQFDNDESLDAQIARDADVLELITTLKEIQDNGNPQAKSWIDNAVKRLKLDVSKDIAGALLERAHYDWWHDNLLKNK